VSLLLWLAACGTGAQDDCALPVPWWADGDGDGWGSGLPVDVACAGGAGTADQAGDCDDTDAAVSPGATEVWYDGIDQDCSGGSDHDADGDGQDAVGSGGEDCDDTDPGTHVGAAEVFYDGIDQDCGVLDDTDPDGDGWLAPAGGGEDCDDLDALVNPGQTEICDNAKDDDCDGTDNGCTLVGEHDVADADVVWKGVRRNTQLSVADRVGDLNHDGYDDIVLTSSEYGGDYDDGGIGWVLFGPLSARRGPGNADALILADREHLNLGRGLRSAGDLDGDGYPEIWVGRTQESDGHDTDQLGWLLDGPVVGAREISDHAVFLEEVETDASDVVFAAATGIDGVPAYVLGLPGDGESTPGQLWVFEGLPGAGAQGSDSLVQRSALQDGGDRLGASLADLDVDGDGVRDLVVGRPGASEAWLILGPLDNDGFLGEPAAVVHGSGGLGELVVAAGDVDGDGLEDWAALAPDEGGGTITLYEGAHHTGEALAPGDAIATLRAPQPELAWAGDVDGGGDFDGNGHGDLVVGMPGPTSGSDGEGRVTLVLGPVLGSSSLEDHPSLTSEVTGDRTGQRVSLVGDTDRDGLDELLIAAPSADLDVEDEEGVESDVGQVLLWLGRGY